VPDQPKTEHPRCPVPLDDTPESPESQARQAFDELLHFCTEDRSTFRLLETSLLKRGARIVSNIIRGGKRMDIPMVLTSQRKR
jgi:hypothetical protein